MSIAGIASISGLLAGIANNYRYHNPALTSGSTASRTPGQYRIAGSGCDGSDSCSGSAGALGARFSLARIIQADSYIPSAPRVYEPGSTAAAETAPQAQPKAGEQPASSDSAPAKSTSAKDDTYNSTKPTTDLTQPNSTQTAPKTGETPDSPLSKLPDGTYYYERHARMEYKLDLSFSLGAITQTAQRMADGDTTAVDQFAAAGFGLAADLGVSGTQTVKTNDLEGRQDGRVREWSADGTHQTGGMTYQNRNVGLQSFYDEALKVRRSLDESTGNQHRMAVNLFASRYRFDNKFSMSFMNRFNVQTQQVADQAPEAAEQYVATAGNVAAKGSAEMMAGFFDAVDQYLNSAEAHLVDKVGSNIEQAALELGFSAKDAAAVKEQLTGTITDFFNRVDQALATVETTFTAPQQGTKPATPLNQYYSPATAEAAKYLATA